MADPVVEGVGVGSDSPADKVEVTARHVRSASSSSSSSSSSGSDSDKKHSRSEMFHLFGRQKPVHSALGGGKRMYLISSHHFVVLAKQHLYVPFGLLWIQYCDFEEYLFIILTYTSI